jgi:hypothetical protein
LKIKIHLGSQTQGQFVGLQSEIEQNMSLKGNGNSIGFVGVFTDFIYRLIKVLFGFV